MYKRWQCKSAILGLLIPMGFGFKVYAQPVPVAYVQIAQTVGVPKKILYAMALVESRRFYAGKERPWPWTLNVSGQAFFYGTREQAIARLHREIRAGNENVAIGIMQIYWRYHKNHFQSPAQVLEPHTNVTYGAQYLKKLHQQYGNWLTAAGKYYTASETKRGKKYAAGYEKKVREQWKKLSS